MNPTLICLLLLSTACAPVGPDYRRPDVAVSATFVEGTDGQIDEVASRQWWTGYQDSNLNDLVARGLQQNLSIATALERIREAEASLRASGAASAMSGDLSGAMTRVGDAGGTVTQQGSGSLSAGLALDLFRGIRRGAQSAAAELGAAKADEGTVRLAYLSAIVGAYIDARFYQESLALTRQSIALRDQVSDALHLGKKRVGQAVRQIKWHPVVTSTAVALH